MEIKAEPLKLSSSWIFYVPLKSPETVYRRLRESRTDEGKCAIFMTRLCKSCRSETYTGVEKHILAAKNGSTGLSRIALFRSVSFQRYLYRWRIYREVEEEEKAHMARAK